MSTAEADVQARLHAMIDPNTGRNLVSAKAVRKMQLDGSNVSIDLQLGYPAKRQHEARSSDFSAKFPNIVIQNT